VGPAHSHRHLVTPPATAAEVAVLLHDAQTSGGLLLAASPQAAPALLVDLHKQGLPAAPIGDVVAGESGHVDVYPARSA
jgi:selenide, water dikinase